ncbi:MAG: TonB-dependent receptor, partial [Rhodospirillaceae bacterium]
NLENYTIFTYSRSDTNGMLNHLFACQSDPTTRASAGAFMGDAACAQVARDSGSIFTVEASEANPRSLIDLWQVINTTTWTANDALTIKNIGSYSEYKEIYQNNASGDNLIMPSSLNLVRGGVVTAVPTGAFAGAHYNFVGLDTHPNYPYTSAQRSMTDELQAHGRVLDNRLMWQAGGYMELSEPLQTVGQLTSTLASCANLNTLTCTDVLSQIVAGGAAAVGTASTRSIRNRFQDYGLYGQGTFEITHQLSMTAGLRYTWDRHRQEGAQLTYNFPPVKGVPAGGVVTFCSNSLVFRPRKFTTKESDCAVSYLAESHRPTWLVDLEYKPIDDVMVWAKYARGYRQGLANTAAPGFEILQPEKVDSYELGAKTSFGGSMPGTFDIVGFYNNLENQQIQASAVARVGSGVSSSNTVINAGKSKIEGVEVDATIKPVEPVTVNLGYTYLKTQLESLTLPDLSTNPLFGSFSVTAAVGGPLVLSPKNKVVLGVTYKMPVPERLGEVSVGGNFVHTDSQLTSAASPLGHVPATDLLNLNLNWNSVAESQVDLSVFATNVTNKKYPAFVVGSLLSTAFEGSIAAEPAMYGLRLRYRFGG